MTSAATPLAVAVGVTRVVAVAVGLVVGGVGATVGWAKRSIADGATTCDSKPAARSWVATASATRTSSGRSAAAPTMIRTALPSGVSQRPVTTSRFQPASVSSCAAPTGSGATVGGAVAV